jgi:hypothetical protein
MHERTCEYRKKREKKKKKLKKKKSAECQGCVISALFANSQSVLSGVKTGDAKEHVFVSMSE